MYTFEAYVAATVPDNKESSGKLSRVIRTEHKAFLHRSYYGNLYVSYYTQASVFGGTLLSARSAEYISKCL